MALSREERNERRRNARFSENYAKYRSRMHQLIEQFRRMREDHISHSDYLAWRDEWFFPYVKGLPLWIKERLTGCEDTLIALHYKELTFCYPHPDSGELRPAKELCNAGLASRIATVEGHHCYRNADGSFTDKFN